MGTYFDPQPCKNTRQSRSYGLAMESLVTGETPQPGGTCQDPLEVERDESGEVPQSHEKKQTCEVPKPH